MALKPWPKHIGLIRRKPMKRTGFERKTYGDNPPAPPEIAAMSEATLALISTGGAALPSLPPPRRNHVNAAISVVLADAESNPFPKFDYVRDERIRDGCRQLACQRCGARGESAGVTWAHSNASVHGKGGRVKASDVYVAAMCWACHRMLDQGSEYTEAQKQRIWWTAHVSTIVLLKKLRLWPENVPLPDIDTYPF